MAGRGRGTRDTRAAIHGAIVEYLWLEKAEPRAPHLHQMRQARAVRGLDIRSEKVKIRDPYSIRNTEHSIRDPIRKFGYPEVRIPEISDRTFSGIRYPNLINFFSNQLDLNIFFKSARAEQVHELE